MNVSLHNKLTIWVMEGNGHDDGVWKTWHMGWVGVTNWPFVGYYPLIDLDNDDHLGKDTKQ